MLVGRNTAVVPFILLLPLRVNKKLHSRKNQAAATTN